MGRQAGVAYDWSHGVSMNQVPADVDAVSPVLTQVWQGRARSQRRCGRDEPQSRCRFGRPEPSLRCSRGTAEHLRVLQLELCHHLLHALVLVVRADLEDPELALQHATL
jgi:hypothetical protein